MRHLLYVAALCCFMSGAARAAGPYDGIYSMPDGSHISVHQKANVLIAAAFWTIPAAAINFYLGDGQAFPPPRVDVWDLYTGTINNNTATLSGETQYGACRSTYTVVFDSGGAWLRWNSIAQTAYGTNQRVNCQAFMNTALTRAPRDFYATKVY